METSLGHSGTKNHDTLAYNESYYKYVFKKTEKIVCAVFYITRTIKDSAQLSSVVKDTEETALALLEVGTKSLSIPLEQSARSVSELRYVSIALESKLRILNASGLLSTEFLTVFVNELDTLLRTSSNFDFRSQNPLFEDETQVSLPGDSRRSSIGKSKTRDTTNDLSDRNVGIPQKLPNRRGRILSVLRDKGHASIKDISDTIKDCSEKTIQRELNAMIQEGAIVREGERRWSRYFIA